MPLHGDETFQSDHIGQTFRQLKELGYLSDAEVAAANTVDGLAAQVTTDLQGATVPGDIEVQLNGFLRAIQAGKELGILTDALIAPLTTVDGLIALSASANTNNHRTTIVN